MERSEILRKAADVIAERGHRKRAFGDKDTGPVCAHGAVKAVMNLTKSISGYTDEEISAAQGDAMETLAREIMRSGRNSFQNFLNGHGSPPPRSYADAMEGGYPEEIVWDFNDTESTSAEDVILMMKRAAEHGS